MGDIFTSVIFPPLVLFGNGAPPVRAPQYDSEYVHPLRLHDEVFLCPFLTSPFTYLQFSSWKHSLKSISIDSLRCGDGVSRS